MDPALASRAPPLGSGRDDETTIGLTLGIGGQ
jgi:hypothetical protein